VGTCVVPRAQTERDLRRNLPGQDHAGSDKEQVDFERPLGGEKTGKGRAVSRRGSHERWGPRDKMNPGRAAGWGKNRLGGCILEEGGKNRWGGCILEEGGKSRWGRCILEEGAGRRTVHVRLALRRVHGSHQA
jgi:hypothetical protein